VGPGIRPCAAQQGAGPTRLPAADEVQPRRRPERLLEGRVVAAGARRALEDVLGRARRRGDLLSGAQRAGGARGAGAWPGRPRSGAARLGCAASGPCRASPSKARRLRARRRPDPTEGGPVGLGSGGAGRFHRIGAEGRADLAQGRGVGRGTRLLAGAHTGPVRAAHAAALLRVLRPAGEHAAGALEAGGGTAAGAGAVRYGRVAAAAAAAAAVALFFLNAPARPETRTLAAYRTLARLPWPGRAVPRLRRGAARRPQPRRAPLRS